jgi:hypothetical protein
LPDLIFADSFESGDLSAWSGGSTNGGNLSVTAGALSETYGLRVFINNNTAMYVEDNSPNSETRYRARFRFDPNSIPMGSGNAHFIFYGYTGASTLVLRMELRCNGGGCPSGGGSYQVQADLRNNSSTWTPTGWFTLSDAAHTLELDWQASASGSLAFWIDGTQQANLSGVNNSNRCMDLVRWGPVEGIDNGTRGTYYLDVNCRHC